MKHLFSASFRTRLQKQLLVAVMTVSIISLSVPPAVFADDASSTDSGTAPVVQTMPTPPVPDVSDTPEVSPTEPAPDSEVVVPPSAPDETVPPADTTESETPPDAPQPSLMRTMSNTSNEGDEGDTQEPKHQCVISSDTSTLYNDQPSVLVTPLHALWTAVIQGASWIWGENPISDAVNEKTETFTKTFYLSNVPTSATMEIASDNSYEIAVGQHPFEFAVAGDSGEFNYSSADTVSINATNFHAGENSLRVTVKNFPMSDGTMATNPAGLLYTLTLEGADCTQAPPPPHEEPITVHATKVVCDDPADLPDWGTGGHQITANTATEYIAAHHGCHLQPDWQFEWGPQSSGDVGDAFTGSAPPADGYTTFGPTDAHGVATVQIPSATEGISSEIHLREVLEPGYIPFTFGSFPDNSASTSAEFYCANDALNYDNWDFIRGAHAGDTYYCVAFNAPVAPKTSTVTMCKVDDQEQVLPGWTLMLKGEHVGSVAVDPDGNDHPVANVPAGNYILTASGAYIYRPGDVAASTSDAAFSLRLPSDAMSGPYQPWILENSFVSPHTGWLGITFNNAFTNWGTVFHPNHTYALGTTLATAQDMHFKILDDQYADNSGSLNVDVDHGYVGVTGENGCTTFENVPYGAYTADELNQDGWTPVTGTGPVMVDAPEQTFTVVNHKNGTVVPPTKYKVHIFKYLWNGDTAEQIPNDSDAPEFPMRATYSIAGVGTNLNPGDSYVLGNGGGVGGSDSGLNYAANTIPLSAGDTYGTHEVTDGSVVVSDQGSCSAGKYYLKGYQVGTTLSEAQGAALSMTAPSFPSISGDEYVIVVNAACPKGDDGGDEGTDTPVTIIVHVADLAGDKADALSHIAKWFFYNDNTDLVDNGLGSFVNGPASTGSPLSTGSAQITLDTTNNRTDLATYGFSGTKLADIKTLRYSAYSHAGVAGATESPYLVFNVTFDGLDTWQKRLVFVPSDNGAVPQDTWNTFDAIDSGTALWQYSGTVWPAAVAGSPDDGVSELGTVARSWNDILADYPSIAVRTTDSLMGVRVGEPGPTGYSGNIDAFVIGIKNGADTTTTTYDFEPTVTPVTPTIKKGGSSRRSGGSVLGVSTTTEPQGKVLGATCGPILSSFLRIGRMNPVDQVTILQNFLNGELMMSLPVTGFFGPLTEKAVEAFQAKYFSDVLAPWVPYGLETQHSVTGYVYKTTQWKINMISCPSLNLPMPTLP